MLTSPELHYWTTYILPYHSLTKTGNISRPSLLVLKELARREDAATATKQRLNHYLQEIALSSTTSAAEMTS